MGRVWPILTKNERGMSRYFKGGLTSCYDPFRAETLAFSSWRSHSMENRRWHGNQSGTCLMLVPRVKSLRRGRYFVVPRWMAISQRKEGIDVRDLKISKDMLGRVLRETQVQ